MVRRAEELNPDEARMEFRPGGGGKSQMTLMGHAVHPMLVTFPIAFFTGTAATDLAYLWYGDPFWAQMSFWLLAGGLVMGGLAALVGMSDFTLVADIRRHLTSWNHFLVAIVMMAIALVNFLQRLVGDAEAVWPWGIMMSLLTVVMVATAGWLGGKMVFEHNLGPGQPLYDAPDIEKDSE
jgi:uncharacterized membrane protein